MNKRRRRIFLQNKFALAGTSFLSLLMLLSVFAGFFSPYSPVVDEFRVDFLRPPSSIEWEKGRPSLRDSQQHVPIRFFVRGRKYEVLGVFESNLHLFGTEERPIFLLGSDQLGRDIFSRILYGARISISIALLGVLVTTLLGLLFGCVAGYYGGTLDNVIMRGAEVVMSVPALYLILALRNMIPTRLEDSYEKLEQLAAGTFAWQADPETYALVLFLSLLILSYYNYRNNWRKPALMASLGIWIVLAVGSYLAYAVLNVTQTILPGSTYVSSAFPYWIIVFILSAVGWAGMSRVVRGMVLSLRESEYILAAKALGSSDARILLHHILPNLVGYVMIRATLLIPVYILGEVSLSFLGLGIPEPVPSWGNLLSAAQDVAVLEQCTWILSPGVFLFLTVLAFNFLGDGLRDAIEVKSGHIGT